MPTLILPVITPRQIVRFWERVDRSGDCWIWTASLKTTGYGKFSVGLRADGTERSVAAHRVAYALGHGVDPDGLDVCHRCDNPLCVRPDHLFLGTAADNMADCSAKGRVYHPFGHPGRRGETSPLAKLTNEKVEEIRLLLNTGMYQRDIAAKFGVAQTTISMIRRGKTWAH